MDDVYFVSTFVYLCITQGSKLGCCWQMEADVAFIIIIISSIPPQFVGCKLEGWHCCRGSGGSDRLSDGSDDLFRLVYDLHQHQHPHLASARTSLAVSTSSSSSSSSSSWWQWWSTRRPSPLQAPAAVFGKQVSAVYRNKKHDTGLVLLTNHRFHNRFSQSRIYHKGRAAIRHYANLPEPSDSLRFKLYWRWW